MNTKELLALQVDMMDIDIRERKQDLIDRLDGLEQTLAYNRMRLKGTLDDSRICRIESFGIIQNQGQMIESRCMEIVTKVNHLSVMKRIIVNSEGE